MLNYKIYKRYDNIGVRSYDIPELDGFWKENVDTPDARWEPQLINGKRYSVATVRKILAFPQQTGTFELKDFARLGYMRINYFEQRQLTATCEPVTLESVAEAASQFAGHIRRIVRHPASLDSLSANEAVTVEVTYEGAQLKFLRRSWWPAEFEVFDAEVEDQINVTAQGEGAAARSSLSPSHAPLAPTPPRGGPPISIRCAPNT